MLQSSLNNLFDMFFYSFPHQEHKPPITMRGLKTKDGTSYSGVEIQFAVAGFKEEDLKVWNEGQVLNVEGNNLRRENVCEKFQCPFSRKIALQENLDIEKAEVSLADGILAISIPLKNSEESRRYLLGGTKK